MVNILIVEDDLDLVETYTDLLAAHGHKVESTARLSDAVEKLKQFPVQIVVLDLHLPGARVSQLGQFVQTAKQICDAAVIIISGHTEMMYQNVLLDKVDLVLTKPVSNSDLLSLVERMGKSSDHFAAGKPSDLGVSANSVKMRE